MAVRMTRMLTYGDIDRTEWRHLVLRSATGTWFQSPEAYAFYASLPALLQPFVLAVETDGRLRGVCVGYVTLDSNPLRQFFTRRAIILGGPCLADDATPAEAESLLSNVKCKLKSEISPIFIESRNFNDYSPWREAFRRAGFAYRPHLNYHVATDGFEVRLSDNRKRQLRKVSTDGLVTCTTAVSEAEIVEWYGVLSVLYRTKVRTPLFPVDFFLTAFRQGVGRFLLVKFSGRVIGGSMVVSDGKCVYEWFECGLNTRFREQYPSVMATFAGIQLAQQTACARYDMMGAGEPGVPYGVRDFKSEFGGTLVEHGRFLHIAHPFLYRLGALAVRLLKGTAQRPN